MFAKLTEFAAPRHRELAEFLQGCSADASTRTIATTALVLTLWQMAGRHMTSRLPSMLLVNSSEAPTDPIDAFIGDRWRNDNHIAAPAGSSAVGVGRLAEGVDDPVYVFP